MKTTLAICLAFLVFQVGAAPGPEKHVLRLIDKTMQIQLAPTFDQHLDDLKSSGWTVETVYVPPREKGPPYTNHIAIAHDVTWPWLESNPGGHVIVIGNVTIPQTGLGYSVTEVKSDQGCLPVLPYYVLPGIEWTDIGSNDFKVVDKGKTNFYYPANRINLPGDGWFDQQTLGTAVPLGPIGMISFEWANAKAWGSTLPAADFRVEAYKRYFSRLHEYRTTPWVLKTPAAYGWGLNVYSNSGGFGPWAVSQFGETGYKSFGPATAKPPFAQNAPYGLFKDFKLIGYTEAVWRALPDKFSVYYEFFGSGNGISHCNACMFPFYQGCLATSTFNLGWDFTDWVHGRQTIGQAWILPFTNSRSSLYVWLWGDPTLRFQEQKTSDPVEN